ncbi:MAG: hypothetical protein AAGC95_17365, partial [Pseudomonadota bacterium]
RRTPRPMTQPNLKESPKPALKNAANQTNANDKSQVQQRFTTIPEGEREMLRTKADFHRMP